MSVPTARLEFKFTLKDGFRVIVTTPQGVATFQILTNGLIEWTETYTAPLLPQPEE